MSEIRKEIVRFRQLCQNYARSVWDTEVAEPVADCFIFGPEAHSPSSPIDLTITALIHGNEVAGVYVLNELLQSLLWQGHRLPLTFCLGLGNVAAAHAGQRFLETDLNRSFGHSNPTSQEQKRGAELTTILCRSKYLLDIHQTMEPALTPFFIFPYQEISYAWARALHPRIPVVTHWQGGFSKDGKCSDEYVQNQGGHGITIELGQNGYSVYKSAVGVSLCLKALLSCAATTSIPSAPEADTELYSWAQILAWPEGDVSLNPGWQNFMAIDKGTVLGQVNQKDLHAETSGFILFPKYLSSPGDKSRPAEICRIIRKITPQELGT